MMAHRNFLPSFLPGRRAAVLALGGLALARTGMPAHASGSTPNNTPNPLYTQSFPRLDQGDVPMQRFLGRPLVANFWASWCPPCVKEMPDLQALSQQYPAIGFVGLAVDSAVNVRQFLQKTPVSYPILLAGPGGIARMRDLGNRQGGLPFTVVFDAQGRVKRQLLGPIQVESIAAFLHTLVA